MSMKGRSAQNGQKSWSRRLRALLIPLMLSDAFAHFHFRFCLKGMRDQRKCLVPVFHGAEHATPIAGELETTADRFQDTSGAD